MKSTFVGSRSSFVEFQLEKFSNLNKFFFIKHVRSKAHEMSGSIATKIWVHPEAQPDISGRLQDYREIGIRNEVRPTRAVPCTLPSSMLSASCRRGRIDSDARRWRETPAAKKNTEDLFDGARNGLARDEKHTQVIRALWTARARVSTLEIHSVRPPIRGGKDRKERKKKQRKGGRKKGNGDAP